MRTSSLLIPTLREAPAEADAASHQLMLRAGLVRQVAAGIYTYLPLGYRVVQKIENIIREEMNRAGGQEILMPILQPAEIWQESGRWEVYGAEMFRLQDRHQRLFCLGPTHEELVTLLARAEIRSYRQLPQLLYQIQNKYRDEKRPRFGVMRGREFIMKDLYSFDRDTAGMEESYRRMAQAYTEVFTRCGLDFRVVEADTGAIGGGKSQEFVALASIGETAVLYCPACDYAANVEAAAAPPRAVALAVSPGAGRELVATPGTRTVEEVAAYLGVAPSAVIKTLFYNADGRPVCVLVRGDRQVNEVKLQQWLGCNNLRPAVAEEVADLAGAPPGSVGPVGLVDIPIYADAEVPLLAAAVTGANREGYHYLRVRPGVDFEITAVGDLRELTAGEPCPQCGAPLEGVQGIEVGQIFQLGIKYSQALGATFMDADGSEKPLVMGCYGIGVSRTMAGIIEQHHDAQGIIWPHQVSPYQAVVIPVSLKEVRQQEVATALYQEMTGMGLEVLLDDRQESPGVKFADADLVGCPFRVIVGRRTVQEGTVDVRERATGTEVSVPAAGVAKYLQGKIV